MRGVYYFWLGAEADIPRITTQEIQRTVAAFYQVPLLEMRARYGGKNSVLPRHVAMYLSRELTGQSFPQIAERFGGRDHTTVINAVNKTRARIANSDDLLAEVQQLRSALAA